MDQFDILVWVKNGWFSHLAVARVSDWEKIFLTDTASDSVLGSFMVMEKDVAWVKDKYEFFYNFLKESV